MGCMSFSQELKELATASEGIDAGGCRRGVPHLHRETRALHHYGRLDSGSCINVRWVGPSSASASRVLLGARAALGISTLLAPRLTAKLFLLDPDDNPQLPVIFRMWGVRNLSIVAGMYAATGADRAQWGRIQVGAGALDLLAIATEWRRGAVPGPASAVMAASTVPATTLGVVLSFPRESEQPAP